MSFVAAIPETLEIWSTEPLRVVRLGSKRYRITGLEIMFDLCPVDTQNITAKSNGNPYRLITKNREIVMQGENACSLSDTKWLIVHRLNNTKSRSLTVDELCDAKTGEAVWEINCVPQTPTLRSYASEVNAVLAKSGIIATLRFSEKTAAFTLQLPEVQDNENNIETETPTEREPESTAKAKAPAKRKSDARRNPMPSE